ncbi:LysM peptidoglycan-binding domain-containing protein [Gordonia sp. NPDC003424]
MIVKYQVVRGDTLSGIAQRLYGDGRLFGVISAFNRIPDPDKISVGQILEIPGVTFRYRVANGDTKQSIANRFYGDATLSEVFEIPNGAAQRNLVVGEWLVIPDLNDPDHHTVVHGETWKVLAERWYGDPLLWTMVAVANRRFDEPMPGQVVIQPGLNRRHTVVAGDTLWALVEHNYGDGGDERTRTLVAMVAAANAIADPNLIQVGARIWFPSLDG